MKNKKVRTRSISSLTRDGILTDVLQELESKLVEIHERSYSSGKLSPETGKFAMIVFDLAKGLEDALVRKDVYDKQRAQQNLLVLFWFLLKTNSLMKLYRNDEIIGEEEELERLQAAVNRASDALGKLNLAL